VLVASAVCGAPLGPETQQGSLLAEVAIGGRGEEAKHSRQSKRQIRVFKRAFKRTSRELKGPSEEEEDAEEVAVVF
jgi:hypothetical protein